MGRNDRKRSRSQDDRQRDTNSRNVHAHHYSEKRRKAESEECDELDVNYRSLVLTSSGDVIVAIRESSSIAIQGKAKVKCVLGECTVFGYNLTDKQPFVPVYSPETNSYITIKCTRGTDLEDGLAAYINSVETVDSDVLNEFVTGCSRFKHAPCVLHMKPLSSVQCGYVSSISTYKNIFYSTSNKLSRPSEEYPSDTYPTLDVCLSSGTGGRHLFAPNDYEYLVRKFTEASEKEAPACLAVCGGKNMGKSTLLRFVLNSCLNSFEKIAYLECDVGQTEFTPSGTLSLNIVSNPLLGPPFTHTRKPVGCVHYGLLSPGDDPGRYLQSIEYLYGKYRSLEQRPPLIVNTMGWNKGLGIAILVDTMKIIHPSFVVQLDSKSRAKNMPDLSTTFFEITSGWKDLNANADESTKKLNFTHLTIDSPVTPDFESSDRYKALDHRNLSLLAYLGGKMEVPKPICSLQPYKVPWKSVALHVVHATVPNSQILYAFNASVVGLCIVEESMIRDTHNPELPMFLKDTPVCECVGFGVVRAIDDMEKVFYLISPLDPSQLQQVNCLMRGALDLPSQCFMDQLSTENIPYIGYPKDVTGASSVSRRRHMQRHRPN